MRIARAFVVSTVFAAAALAQETTRYSDSTGKFALELPTAWKVEVVEPETAKLGLMVEAPGVQGRMAVGIYVLHGPRDPLAQAYYERSVHEFEPQTVSVKVEPGPPPILLWRYRDGQSEYCDVYGYSVVNRNGVHLSFTIHPDDWARIRPAYLHAMKTLHAEVPVWPPAPKGFRRSEHRGYVWFVHPDVKARRLNALRTLVRRVEARYAKAHGKVLRKPGNLPFIVVCNSIGQARNLDETIGRPRYGAAIDPIAARLFLTPLPEDPGPNHASAAEKVAKLLHVVKYGTNMPYWMYDGEGELAWSEERTGAKPPKINKELFEQIATNPDPLKQVWREGEQDDPDDAFYPHANAYTIFFRAGPASYRRAYAAFRKDLEKTGDPTGAMQRHLMSLDQAKLQEDITRWIARSVVVAPRK